MKFHKEGYTSLALVVLLFFVLSAIAHYNDQGTTVKVLIYIISILLLFWVLQFYRNPSRQIKTSKDTVLAPADGTISSIEESEETAYFKDARIKVRIAVSPLDVHLLRVPLTGDIVESRLDKAKSFFALNTNEADRENSTLIIKSSSGKEILCRVTAGKLPKSIIHNQSKSNVLIQGEEFGFIKCSASVDIFLPKDTVIHLKVGDKVKSGLTLIANL